MSVHRIDVLRIKEIEPHPNADNLQLTKISGWQCCIKKGEFQVGDLVVYVEPDYMVPTDRPEFAFLAKEGKTESRIKVKKLRGVISQGLILKAPEHFNEGDNAIDYFGIKRYVPPLDIQFETDNVPDPAGLFAPKYDVESLNRYISLFQTGEEIIATEKIHGCLKYDTKVMLPNGEERNIDTLEIGDLVLSFNEKTREFEPDVVENVLSQDLDKGWIRLEFDNGKTLFCTVDHKILTNSGWIEAQHLTEDHEIVKFE